MAGRCSPRGLAFVVGSASPCFDKLNRASAAALAAAAAGLLWWRRRRRRAAVAALPHGTSKGALHSGSSNGKGGGGADASVEELHILQHKGVAGSRASGSEIPAGWR